MPLRFENMKYIMFKWKSISCPLSIQGDSWVLYITIGDDFMHLCYQKGSYNNMILNGEGFMTTWNLE